MHHSRRVSGFQVLLNIAFNHFIRGFRRGIFQLLLQWHLTSFEVDQHIAINIATARIITILIQESFVFADDEPYL